jgi:hypothetical protein
MLNGVSTNGTTDLMLQLGDSGGIETSSYAASSSYISTSVNTTDAVTWGNGFGISLGATAATITSGTATISNISANTWLYQFVGVYASGDMAIAGGSKTLSATLDRIRLTTDSGTNTFDAGSVNIMYEG